jgi:hypothetical protein
VSKYETHRLHTTRNAVIPTTRLVASSGLTRANRVQGTAHRTLVPSLMQP